MHRVSPLAGLVIGTLVLAGCFGQAASSTPDSSAAASAAESVAAASAAASADELGPFSCDLPIHVDATVPRANILDVRAATNAGYDRVVFEFASGLPEALLERAEPPFTHDASGEPIAVAGASFLRLTLIGGTKQMDDGSSSYSGPLEFESPGPMLVHLIEGGDFEARSTWYLGMASEACVRVLQLAGEGGTSLLVIDVEQ